ncbi:MAG TPA: DUF397 domain-containing protein [Streptosporangiaceae bacterium]|jgi:hypothetical protein|nr:DUF397 domain-containing protein [Streptosporangiaceae bacterium]
MSEQAWVKSSYSGSQANCVEVTVRGRVRLRDTRDRAGPVLIFRTEAWREFTSQVKAAGSCVGGSR